MPNFCNIVVCGHLGQNARLKDAKGQSVLEFSLAYNARKDGDAAWYRCAIWGSRGEKLAPMLTKGTAVIVSGTLDARVFTDKDGKERTSLDVRVDQLGFAGSKGEQIPAPSGDAEAAQARELFIKQQQEARLDEDPFADLKF